MEHGSDSNWARFTPSPIDGVSLMQARFVGHAFDRHAHDTWSIGLTQSGVQSFHCRGTLHRSHPGQLILFNPDEMHDGHAGAPEGFGYQILYVPSAALDDARDPLGGHLLARFFSSPVGDDAHAARLFVTAAEALRQRGESLRAAELLQHLFRTLLARHGEHRARATASPRASSVALARARDMIEAQFSEDLPVETMAEVTGLSRVHFTRAFARTFGLPPHVYLNAVRLRHASRALLSGEPVAEVAAACGFADQPHFTRRFRGTFGLTPGQWVKQMRR